ncbi:hypothetical protein COV13_03620 [Candidatus Woesearchaeota archaeon CG10_big_fil_rev_8_21_14_0_10_32_9]|nr:MAG: hypothetical protein COV13_03620 [Candidatus Woesearchaeota archaeon CG10_big_fil_rev_8_21_14_0_10_32_9]
MGFWYRTFYPILLTIQEDGKINNEILAKKLKEVDKQRFTGSTSEISNLIDYQINCLYEQDEFVIYNKEASRYTKYVGVDIERSIQAALHRVLGDKMEHWKLYDLKTRGDKACFMSIPVENIPKNKNSPESSIFERCDYPLNERPVCSYSCGIDELIRIENMLAKVDMQDLPLVMGSKTLF